MADDKIVTNNIKDLANEIKGYLVNHPEASDSLEGIAKWWLVMQRYEVAMDKVQEALEHLVDEGEISKSSTTVGKIIYYSCNPKSDIR